MVNPATSTDNNGVAMALMQHCVRHDLVKVFPNEMAVMRSYFEQTLVKSFVESRKHDLDRETWWKDTKELCAFVLPVDAVTACFKCKDEWATVEVHLQAAVSSGDLGRVLFGKCWKELAGDKVSHILRGRSRKSWSPTG